MKTIAVFFGGQSVEHDVSIISALSAVIKPLKTLKDYEVLPIYIAKDGTWYSDDVLTDVVSYQNGKIDEFMRSAAPVSVEIGGGLTVIKSSKFAGRKAYKKIDIAFPVMHGTNGEDGALMGLLQMAGIPYVGCGLAASAIAMDKVTAKLMAEAHKIATPKMQFFSTEDYAVRMSDWHAAIKKQLTFPLFVKPATLGSSIGITRVENEKELTNAIEVAMHYDSKIIVEEAVPNLIEVTVPIIGNDELTPALVEQPADPNDGVFDFESKYMNQGKGGGKKMGGGKTQGAQGYSHLPAKISDKLYEEALRVAKVCYKAVGCEGIARIDLLIDSKKDIVYFNEINPLPGSLYAHNWAASGISNVDLVKRLIVLAEDRHLRTAQRQTVFSTNFLKQF